MEQYEEPTIQVVADDMEDVITGSDGVELPEMPITLQF